MMIEGVYDADFECAWCAQVGVVDRNVPHIGTTLYAIGDIVTFTFEPAPDAETISGKAKIVGWNSFTHKIELETVADG